MSHREALMNLLCRKSLIRGRVTLTSGAISDYYFDCKLTTLGGSTMEAIEIAEAEGFNVVAVVSLVDREEGGSEKLGEKYNYHAIFTARELLQENERAVRAHIKSPRTCAPNKSILIFQSLVFQKNSTL